MPNSKSIYSFLGKITASALSAVSVLVIVASFLDKEKDVSYDRLKQAYDGLSPRDYQ